MLSPVSPNEDIKPREAAQLKRIAAVCMRFRTRKDDLRSLSFRLREIKIGNPIRRLWGLFLSQNIALAPPSLAQLCGAFKGQTGTQISKSALRPGSGLLHHGSRKVEVG